MVIQKYNLNETPSKKEKVKKQIPNVTFTGIPYTASNYPKPKKRNLKWLVYLWLVVGVLAVFSYIGKLINEWFDVNRFEFHKLIEVKIQKPITIEQRKPIEVVSPIVEIAEESIDFKDLTNEETIILEAFGIENFKIMRAIAKCESNLNPEAVNWTTKDVGLFQINYPTWKDAVFKQFGYTLTDLFDAKKNTEVARWIFDRDGNGDGSINPWTATRTSCFTEELK